MLKLSENNYDLPLFHKFDTSILIITKYHTIVSSVIANTKNANKNKMFNDFDPITLLSIITCSKSSYVAIAPDPTNFLSKWFPLAKRSIRQLLTHTANNLDVTSPKLDNFQLRLTKNLYFAKVFHGVYWNSPLDE